MTRGADNPFATRYVRPDVVPFLFSPGLDPDRLIARWESLGRRGAIVGPHGAGKTTLLHTLVRRLREAGWEPAWFTLREGQIEATAPREGAARWHARTLVVVDGGERLSWWRRWRLGVLCHKRGAALLVTSHRVLSWPQRCPVLLRLTPTEALARQLVRQFAPQCPVSDGEIDDLFRRRRGNLRETLFAAYDLYERRRP